MKRHLSTIAIFLLSHTLYAQTDCDSKASDGYFGPTKQTVILDFLSGFPETDIPFDRWFYLKKVYPKEVVISSVALTPAKISVSVTLPPICFEQKPVKDQPDFTEVTMLIPPLKPNSSFFLVLVRKLNVEEKEECFDIFQKIQSGATQPGDLATARALLATLNATKRDNGDSYPIDEADLFSYYYQHLRTLLDTWAASNSPDEKTTLKRQVFEIMDTKLLGSPVNGTSIFRSSYFQGLGNQSFSFDTRTKYVLVPDFGYVVYGLQPNFTGSTPYIGVAVNLRSFDPDIPLGRIKGLKPWQYLSFNLGLTLGSVAKTDYRENLLGSRTLLTGVGVRLTQALKINAGALWYNRLSVNQLVDEKKMRPVFYVGLSLDFRLKEILKDVSAIFTGNFLPSVR